MESICFRPFSPSYFFQVVKIHPFVHPSIRKYESIRISIQLYDSIKSIEGRKQFSYQSVNINRI